MKIFQVLCGKTWGGGSVVVHAITKALIDRGDEVWVFSFEEESDRRFLEIGARLARPPLWVDSISPLDVLIFAYLFNLCRKEKFDLVATHTSKGGFLGRLASRLAGVPCIVHHAHGFSFNKDLTPLSRNFYISLEKMAAKANDLIISVNEHHRQMAIDLGVEKAERIRTVANGIDIRPFANAAGDTLRNELGFLPSVPVIGSVGRLCPQKGISDLIRAFTGVLSEFPSAQLVIAGTGPLEDDLRAQARDQGIADNVHFIGFRRDIPEVLAAFDIYVQPSLWEGHSISLIEALAAGKAIVTTDIDGNRDAVESGQTAIVVPPGDPVALSTALLNLLEDRKEALELGSRARKAAQEFFTQERMVEQNIAAYDAAIANSRTQKRNVRSLISQKVTRG